MQVEKLRYSKFIALLVLFHFSTLMVYLIANIVTVGEMMGTALPLLAFNFVLSSIIFFLISLQRKLYLRNHLFLFFLLMGWVAFRVSADLGDIYYLKQITIATTGGMVLFYFLGAFLGLSYNFLLGPSSKVGFSKLLLLLFSILIAWLLLEFSQRMHPDLFYLLGINGFYQRPGNFLSILFILFSFAYLLLILKSISQAYGGIRRIFWLLFYTFSTVMALVASQLFGSNSATGVIMGVYLITLVFALVSPIKKAWLNYLCGKISLPWSKRLLKQTFLIGLLGIFSISLTLFFLVHLTGFDISRTNLFGFGSGSNNSLVSRADILVETGALQLSYAPFFGNINVAYLTTGDAGRTLHSFFPYVIANLGLFGLIVVLSLFSSVFIQLYNQVKRKYSFTDLQEYIVKTIYIYSIFILTYVLFFANISTDISWPVLWFTLGFVSRPFGFKLMNRSL